MDNLEIITPAPSHDLTDLKSVKEYLEVCDNNSDAILNRLIKVASDYVVKKTKRKFALETVREKVKGYGRTDLMLSRTPIISISSVTDGLNVILDYNIEDAEAGILYRENGWRWTRVQSVNYSIINVPSSEKSDFIVEYTAGYILPSDPAVLSNPPTKIRDLPYDLESFVLDYVKFLFTLQKEGDISVQSYKIGDVSVTRGVQENVFLSEMNRRLESWVINV